MARPRYQKGSVFRRGKVWVLRYREDIVKPDGTLGRLHRSIVLGALSKKKEALREAERRLRPFNAGAFRPQAVITLDDFWHRYFVPEMLPTLKVATRKLYSNLASKHVLPYFGSFKLSEIQRVQIQHFVTEKHKQDYSVKTLAHFRGLLSKILGTALSWGWLQDNVALGVKLPPREPVREARILAVAEIMKVREALAQPVRTMFVVGLSLGLRIGELLPLRLSDVDLDAGLLYVRRDYYRGHLQTPKTARSERLFKLPRFVAEAIKSYLGGRTSTSDLLFPSAAGTIFDDRNLMRREVEPVCDRLKIPRFGWHSLRHTFSTVAENNRVPVSVVQSLLGHTNPSTTMLYAHAQDESKQNALELVSGVLFPNVPNSQRNEVKVENLIQ